MEINDLHIDVVRKPIRRMHLRVKSDGTVVVSAPWLTPQILIHNFVLQQYQWILQTRERVLQHPPQPLPTISKQQVVALQTYLNENVEKWRIMMHEQPVTWRLRNMKTQWGNCRAQTRQITFNLQLALVPQPLVDYIIVHELSHLQVQNHGPLFKARLSQFMPDWKVRRQQLKEYLIQLHTSNEQR